MKTKLPATLTSRSPAARPIAPGTATSHDAAVLARLRSTPALAAEYLTAALEDPDPKVLLLALRKIAESQGGITRLAQKSGLERESLHRALSPTGNPRFSTLNAITKSLGLRLTVQPTTPKPTKRKPLART